MKRFERWRHVRWTDGASQLYDEAVDPEETQDPGSDPRHAGLIQEMQNRLKKVGPFQPAETSQPQRPKGARKSS